MPSFPRAAAVLAEARLLNRHIIRTPAIFFWLLAAVGWPLSYVALLGNTGTTPLTLALSLSAIPVGPLLYTVFGARLAAAQGREIAPSWPATGGLRALGAGLVLVGWGALGSLAVLACTLWAVEPGFFHPIGFAISSLGLGLGMLVPTTVFWTAIGFALGHRTRGIFRTVLAVLAPIGVTAAVGYEQGYSHMVGASPLLGFIGLSTAGWFTGQVDAFGLGPFAAVFTWAAWLMAILALFALALSALSAYGRQVVAASLVALSLVGAAGVLEGLGQEPALLPQPLSTPGASYRAGAKSPVTVTSMAIDLSLEEAPMLRATTQLQFTVIRPVRRLRFYLVKGLRVGSLRVNGQRAPWRRVGKTGWLDVALRRPLAAGAKGSLFVAYRGNPLLLSTGLAPSLTTFVGAQGWLLAPGTWYPLVGAANAGTRFLLRLQAPSGYLSVTPYGVVDGSTRQGSPITGTGTSISLAGGHLAPYARRGGMMIYVASDELSWAHAAFTSRALLGPNTPTPAREAACLSDVLRPTASARMVLTTFGPVVPTSGIRPWQSIPPVVGATYYGPLALGGGPSWLYESTIEETFGPLTYALWLNGGRTTYTPQTGAAGQLGAALVAACSGSQYNNGLPELDQVGARIAALPRSALRAVTRSAYAAYRRGQLTEALLQKLWQAAKGR